MLSFSKRSLIALMLALAGLAALFCVSISAAEETTVAETTVGETTEGGTGNETAEVTTAGETSTAEETTASETTAAETTKEETTTSASSTTSSKMPGYIVSIVVVGLTVALGLFFGIRNREKLGAFLRSVRSETKKKISWSSFKDTKKNTIVVLVVVAVIAVVIFILDSAFGYGIKYLRELVQGLVR